MGFNSGFKGLNSSVSSASQLTYPTLLWVVLDVVFLPVTRSFSLRPSVSFHAYYVPIPFQPVVIHPLHNCFCHSLFFLIFFFFVLLVVWRSFHLLSKNPILWGIYFFSLTCNPLSKFSSCNLKSFLSLYKVSFFYIHRKEPFILRINSIR